MARYVTFREWVEERNEWMRELVSLGVADDINDSWPRFCEICDATYNGSMDDAIEAGWQMCWDGWVCIKCQEPDQ